MYGAIDTGEANRAVQAAIDHGINLFDTAEVYGPLSLGRIAGQSAGKPAKRRHSRDQSGIRLQQGG